MKFRLQRVLDLRYSQEELAKKELSHRERSYQAATREVNLLLEDEGRLWELIREQQLEKGRLSQWQQFSDFNAVLLERLQKKKERRRDCREQLEEQRAEVKVCWQKRRILEILQGKAMEKYRETVEKREQQLLDELVLLGFSRRGVKNR